ncbi:MAG: hypothetical protein U0836_17130 [Pirellulales bacterium]
MIVAFARDLRDKLAEAVRSIAALARNLGTESLPEQSYTVEWMEPVSAGNWKGRTAEKSEPSFRSLWREFRESFENDDSVRSLHDCVEKFVEEKAQCPPIWTPLVVSRLGGGAVLNEYYRRVRSLALDPNVVGNVVEEFVRDLGSDTAEIRATYVVHGLSADAPFEIPHGYGFRPIDRGDIDRFGRTIDPFGWIPARGCRIVRIEIAKSDLTAFNELQNRIEMVAIALNELNSAAVSASDCQFDSPT